MSNDLFDGVGILGYLDTVALCACRSDLKKMIPYSTANERISATYTGKAILPQSIASFSATTRYISDTVAFASPSSHRETVEPLST